MDVREKLEARIIECEKERDAMRDVVYEARKIVIDVERLARGKGSSFNTAPLYDALARFKAVRHFFR